MSKIPIKENAFDAAPGGTAGAITYQAPYGTHASPTVSQNPAQFDSSNRNKVGGIKGNTAKNIPKDGNMQRDLNTLYAKKDVPSPDEVVTGIKYEMGQQIKKDPALAKRTVVKNLKKDPHFYSTLKMMNIDDKSMVDNMTESKHPNDAPARDKVTPNIEETKKIFQQMGQAHGKKYVVNSQIVDVMREMWAAKQERSAWRNQK